MSKRLGEALIERGVLNADQLRMALDAQTIYGGHLGTCLVELGFVELDTLGQTLAESFNVEHAHRGLIEKIPAAVVELLPVNQVVRHKAIPFAIEGRTLKVAMVNPGNLLALDELSFASGCKIEPWVAPEILVVRAMEVYYQVSRKLRHIPLSGDRPRPAPSAPSPAPAHGATPSAPPPERPADPVSPLAADPGPRLPATPNTPGSRNVEGPAAPRPLEAEPPAPPRPLETEPPAPPRPLEAKPPAPPRPLEAKPPASPKPAGRRQIFLPQTRRSYPEPHGVHVDWIKVKAHEDEPERWSDLLALDLDEPYFDGLEGVCVVWHHGRQPAKARFTPRGPRSGRSCGTASCAT
jgi:hypothetical protein